jgi:hypothetical protein
MILRTGKKMTNPLFQINEDLIVNRADIDKIKIITEINPGNNIKYELVVYMKECFKEKQKVYSIYYSYSEYDVRQFMLRIARGEE